MFKGYDLTGRRFGKLVVEAKASSRQSLAGTPKVYWRCRCDCGGTIEVWASSLTRKKRATHSCGCIRVHRQSKTTTFSSWSSMINRCTNPAAHQYRWYGGRGISVHPPWLEDYRNFLRDMGERPAGCTLDRVDPNGNYEPGNCRWADSATQGKNRRNSLWITFNGEPRRAIEVAQELGISYQLFHGWIKKDLPLEERAKRFLDDRATRQRLGSKSKVSL